MRIAYVINSIEAGGAQFPIPSIAEVMRGAGHEVAVFALALRDGLALPALEAAGLEVRVCPWGEKEQWRTFRWLEREVRAWKATHLWTSLTRATLLGQQVGRRLSLPVASWQHSAHLKAGNRFLLRKARRLSCLWIGDSQTVTEFARQELGIPAENLGCWPIFRADPDAPQSRAYRPGDVLHIGSLGRFFPEKSYDIVCQALMLLKDVPSLPAYDVVLGGDGPMREELRRFVQENGLTACSMPGFVTDTTRFLTGLHLYLQPSRWEGFCVAVHEAMQAGLPVIGTPVGEMRHSIVEGVTGWKVPLDAPQALADALAEALRQPEKLAAMGARGRERIGEAFGPEPFRQTGEALLRRLEACRR